MKRLLTIGHSYVVALNRQLAHQMALQGRGNWEVTAIAPARYRGDLGAIALEPMAGEADSLEPVPIRFDRVPHLMWFGGETRTILARDWDVIHCWEEPYVHAAARIAREASPRARVVYATFQNLSKRYPWPFSRFERTSLRRAAGWIAFGHTVEETVAPREGYGAVPHRVIPPGVDVERFRPNPDARGAVLREIGWPADALVVGYVGRFVAQKGIADLCAALERTHAPWHALFVGGGELQPDLERFAAAHPGRVHIANGVQHSQVPRWINAMTILCAPSRTTTAWREQFGRMLIEAMACGVPVVASDSGEMPHVVADAGRLAPEQNPNAWADAIDALLTDEGARRAFADRGLARARSTFAWPVVARRHLDFFDAILDGTAPC
jgi:glycosyltransferase involved in cell wall biosynthesis